MKKQNTLFNIILLIGVVPFIVGWLIFLVWLAARHMSATDFQDLEVTGIVWVMISFWISIVGLVAYFVYVLINAGNFRLWMLLPLFAILINIPAVFIIGRWQALEDRRVFVKLVNESGDDNMQLTLIGNFEPVEIGSLNRNDSKVFHYEPTYSVMSGRIYQKPDTLRVIISSKNPQDTIGFPTLSMGACRHLILNQNLDIVSLE